MPYIQFNDQQYPLNAAELTVGSYEGAALRLPGEDPNTRCVLMIGADGTGLVRRGGPEAVVYVNGVQLGAEPSPLLHGDKLSVGSSELRYGDDVKGGSTQFLSSVNLSDALKGRGAAPKKPTTATGGRLVSLVDGREYPVPDSGVTFGREIGNEIVIASTDVSRKHATIAPAEGGYVLTDQSTNGLTINGVKVDKTQLLGRGDVIKIGPEEYRFYADVAKAPAAAPAAPLAGASTERASVAAASAPPPAPEEAPALVAVDTNFGLNALDMPQIDMAVIELEDVMAAATPAPAAPPKPVAAAPAAATPTPPPAPPKQTPASEAPTAPAAKQRQPMATLEVINAGPMKGTKFEIFTPLTNIGRGAHNDVSLNDESVSDSHAKILKRDGSWWLVDQGSTNGSYIGGKRVSGEQQIMGAPDVRFGSVKMTFRSTPVPAEDDAKGTKAIAAFSVDAAKKVAEKKRATQAAAPVEPAQVPAEKKKGCMAMIAFLIALGAAGATMMAVLLTVRG